jgi:hypothetical protein
MVSGLGLFPFQACLRLTWNLFLLTCKFASFHSYRFKDNISKILHENYFSNVILNILSNFHHTQLRSCANPSSSAWFSTHSFILSFCMASKYIFSSTLCTRLSLPHLIVHGLAHCIYGQPIDLTRIHLLRCSHGAKCIVAYNTIQEYVFASNAKDVRFHVLQ